MDGSSRNFTVGDLYFGNDQFSSKGYFSFGSYSILAWLLFDSYSILAWLLSDSYSILAWLLFDSCLTLIQFLLDSCLTLIRSDQNWFFLPHSIIAVSMIIPHQTMIWSIEFLIRFRRTSLEECWRHSVSLSTDPVPPQVRSSPLCWAARLKRVVRESDNMSTPMQPGMYGINWSQLEGIQQSCNQIFNQR